MPPSMRADTSATLYVEVKPSEDLLFSTKCRIEKLEKKDVSLDPTRDDKSSAK